jgi:hypothetical protein
VFNAPKHGSATVGPRYARIRNNKFENIEEQAIYAGVTGNTSATFHISQNNTFINVGNYFNDLGERSSTGTAVISFLSDGNSSVDDYFDRYHFQSLRRLSTLTYNPLIDGRASIDSSYVSTATLTAGLGTPIVRVPITGYTQQLHIKYNIVKEDVIDRMGNVEITIRSGDNPDCIVTDNFNYENFFGLIEWVVRVNAAYKYVDIICGSGEIQDLTIEYQTKIML